MQFKGKQFLSEKLLGGVMVKVLVNQGSNDAWVW